MNLRNVLILAKKELRAHLTNVSNFLVLAGVLLVMSFLFFNNFYLVGVAQLDDLFGLFPWVFAILVPAISMGLIAKERQDRTLYYLFARPVDEVELVLGKFLGTFAFLSLFVLVTVIIPLTLSSVAPFDAGVIVAGYLGTLLLLGLFLAVGLAVSALFPNPLAVFVVSFITNLFLILIGSDLIGNMVPPFAVKYVTQLSPLDHFGRISRGLIEASDMVYFVLATLAFLLLAVWRLHTLRGGKLSVKRIAAGISVQFLAVALIVGAYFSFLIPGRVDITNGRVYTLASGTERIVSSLPDEVEIDVYVSEDLPPAFQPALLDIRRVVEEIAAINGSKVKVVWKNPDSDPAIADEAKRLGIYPRPFSVISQTELQSKEGYLGIAVKHGDDTRVIPFIQKTSDLEYQLVKLIYDLTVTEKPVVALVYDSGSVPTEADSQFVELLRGAYDVKLLKLPTGDEEHWTKEDVDGVSAFVIIGLSDEASEEDLKLIKNAVAEGAGLVVFSAGVDIDLATLSASKREHIVANDLLKEYGMAINPDIVFDKRNANLLTFSTPQGRLMLPYPYWPTVAVESDNALLSQYRAIVLKWGSSMSLNNGESDSVLIGNEKVRVLAKTGSSAGTVSENINLAPDAELPGSELSTKTVGAYLPREDSHGEIVAISSDMMLRDDFIGAGGDEIIFATLLVDMAAQNDDLASIKAKNRIPAKLRFENDSQKSMLRFANMLGGPLLIVIIGGAVWYLRRRKMTKTFTD